MATTIQISKELHNSLKKRKLSPSESFEELLWDLLEDSLQLNDETKKEIEQARKDYTKGKFYTIEQVEKEAGI